MAKAIKKAKSVFPKPKKKASKYNEKIVVDASFEGLVKELLNTPNKPK